MQAANTMDVIAFDGPLVLRIPAAPAALQDTAKPLS